MKRGSIYWINFEPASPPEFGKVRPGLIISNSEQNSRLSTVVVVPLSTQTPSIWPLRIIVDMPGKKKSFAVLPGIRQVNKARLKESIGITSLDSLAKIDEALLAYLHD